VVNNSRIFCLRLLALLALGLTGTAEQASAATPEPVDRVIVKWRTAPADSESESRETRRIGERTGLSVSKSHHIGVRLSVMQLDRARTGAELNATLAALRADPDIEMVEPDRRVHAHAFGPSDPLFAGQWYLQGVQPAGIRADSAWDVTHGGASPATSTVVVAVLDTGVRFEHPDLRRVSDANGKLLPGYDFVSGDSTGTFATSNDGNGWDPDPSDPGDYLTATDLANPPFKNADCGDPSPSSWHGTRTAGMIAADTNNAMGIAGTAFNVRILPVRVLGKCGGFDSDVIAGMYWAAGMLIPPPLLLDPTLPANPNPAQVINMSLGGTGPCSSMYATAVQDITAHGVLIVVSAGNEGTAVDSPGNCAGTLAVAGLRHIGTKVGYSNLGPEIGIAAPAGNCVNITAGSPCLFSLDTTTNDGTQGPAGSSYTNQINSNVGTSFSAPQAAGAAALMKTVNPALTPALLIARMKASARTFPTTSDNAGITACVSPTVNPLQDTECICNTAVCGAGMLDAGAAVVAAQRPVALAQVTGTVGVGRTLSLDGSQSGASIGRAPLTYMWTVLSVDGGAATPMIQSPNQAIATVLSPTTGSYSISLTVTDSLGATDSAIVTVSAGSSGSTSPPPATGNSGGGGSSPSLLILFALLFLARSANARWRART
jgi:serine protease